MKLGFENSYQLLDGFAFADSQSRENALWARLWAVEAMAGGQAPIEMDLRSRKAVAHRPPMVVITGPDLAEGRRLFGKITSGCEPVPGNFHQILGDLNRAAAQKAPVMIFDNWNHHLSSMELNAFLSAETWQTRHYGSHKLSTYVLRTLVVVNGNVTLCPDLARRAIFIRLSAPGGGRAFVVMAKQLTMTLPDAVHAALEAKGALFEQGASEFLKGWVIACAQGEMPPLRLASCMWLPAAEMPLQPVLSLTDGDVNKGGGNSQ